MQLTQSLHRNISQRPDQIAVIEGESHYSYRELGERVASAAAALRQLGVQDGERVAILSLNSSVYLEYVMAVPWAGGALNPVNIRWTANEIAYSLDDSDTRILLVDDTFLPLMEKVQALSTSLQTLIYCGQQETPSGMLNYQQLVRDTAPMDDCERCGDQLGGVFYTGGTTGFPKGVMLSHTNLVGSSIAVVAENVITDGARYLHAAPMFHMADFAMMMAVYMRGGVHVVNPAFDPTLVLDSIAKEQISHVLLVPTMVQMTLAHPEFERFDLSSLDTIIYGASPMPLDTVNTAMQKIPHVGFIQAYGMTELAPLATVSGKENHTQAGLDSGRIRSAGRAGALQQVKIVDPTGQEMPRGEVGEVIVKGPNVMLGYWNKPEATAEAIRGGWMHTGDAAWMDDGGYIYIADRLKDMIISGGENIYSAEVENILMQHPAIASCAVIGIPSQEWGEAVHAVLVSATGEELDLETLQQHCREKIAGYKIPRSLEWKEALPLSGAGKILKTELRKPWWQDQDQGVS
ncbi:long-chain fatty acid--CoA ligase [Aestuariirhabdus sp. Z084]|uniref:acyl-CoA synthetase n=1 Tax=Aestuariirhabdus haliotis TaxID=2918751 RepID=UPI00201B3EFB|nr:long-chain fatty acid--CoA ligase [Aestuariirhabdus haliotis]MCL6417684.1 long-chain fatty acid--CoA ligase [Aestuariirhabdus haliotis]MCL6421623.1 long-chain fatty acid--CoA ligase [Aestuariirhabdus haliotis]